MVELENPPFNPQVLRAMRRAANLSLEEVALVAGLSDKGQISRFERGTVIPMATTLGRILHALQPEPSLLYALFQLPLPDCTYGNSIVSEGNTPV